MNPRQQRHIKRWNYLKTIIFTSIQSISVSISLVYYYLHSSISNNNYIIIIRLLCFLFSLITYILWFISRIQLGTSLTLFIHTNKGPLITTGMYSKFSNPIYLFGTISLFLYILAINYQYLIIFIILIPIQYIRATLESKALAKKYGDIYDEYINNVWI